MLIRCPKCGFQQPTDKYCAQCGVDIENFKPQSVSATKKFFTNPLMHLSLIVIAAGGIGFSFYQDYKSQQAAKPTPASRQLQVSSTTSGFNPQSADTAASAEQAAPPSETEGTAEVASTEVALTAAAQTSDAGTPADVEATAPTQTPTAAPAKNSGSPHLKIYYAEVTDPELQGIYEMSRGTGQFMSFGDYTAGILPEIEKRITPSNLNIKVLHREERAVEAKTPVRLAYGKPSVGLEIFIEPTGLDAQSFRGNMDVRRTWMELGANQTPKSFNKSFPASIELTSAAGFFISGVLPRKTPVDNDNEIANINVFRILRSPAFQRGDTEFVIFIEFDRNN
jgi:hypothetical protein